VALPKKYRLQKRSDFARLKKEGRLYSHPYLGVLVLEKQKNQEDRFSQFGFIISTKVAKKAFQRFKLKRQLSEIVYSLFSEISDNRQVVFLPKKALLDKSFLEIKKAVEEVFIKAGVLKK